MKIRTRAGGRRRRRAAAASATPHPYLGRLVGAGALVAVPFLVRPAVAAELDPGLITAVDHIGGNLLGTSAFDAVLADPIDPDLPQRLGVYLSTAQSHPVEVVLVTTPPTDPDAPPSRAFFRLSVGGPEGLKLEYDPAAGDIIPCILPPGDLSGIGPAPADSGNTAASFRSGLVTALGEVGKNLLGAAFDAVAADPIDPDMPQRLRVFVSRTSPVELLLTDPAFGERIFLQVMVGGPEVTLQADDAFGGTRVFRIEEADLSGLGAPPEPDRQ